MSEISTKGNSGNNGNNDKANEQKRKKRNRNRNKKKGGNNNNPNSANDNDNVGTCIPVLETQPGLVEEGDDEDVPDHHLCMICYSSNLHLERGIAPCGHDSICSSCHLRLRSLLNDKRCPVCKTTNEQIIVDADDDAAVDEHKSFDQYEKWGDDIGPNYTYRDDVGMFFPVAYCHAMVVPLFRLSCNVKRCDFGKLNIGNGNGTDVDSGPSLKELISHLATSHNPPLQICELCMEHKRDFISRLPRFTANQLRDHNKYGDVRGRGKPSSSSANKGHPMCNFCQPRRFYDLTKLHEHLNKEHYECHVCKRLGKPLQYFKDYNKLNQHFDRQHYLCRFPECLAARFVVFSNDIDLKAHERDVHGLVSGSGGSTKIQMEFRVRSSARDGSGIANAQFQQVPNMEDDFGFGLDGEVFVPESLEDNNDDGNNNNGEVRQHNEPDITHGPHAERTALLREQARARREELGLKNSSHSASGEVILQNEEEAFPTLGSQGEGNLISWSGRNGAPSAVATIRGRNTTALNQENFPSLGGPSTTGGSSTVRRKAASSKLRATRTTAMGLPVAGNATSSFAAMSQAANVLAPQTTSRPFANAATRPLGAADLSSTDVFPSLGGGPVASNGGNSFSSAMSGRKNSKPRLTSDNFPSLGAPSTSSASLSSGGGNTYSAAQAFAKKRSGMNLNMDQHFPSATATMIQKTTNKKNSSLNKKPAARNLPDSDNFLSFPPPPMATSSMTSDADAKAQVEAMKLALGPAKYKKLKKFTKEFASSDLDPESYVTSALSLFDDGMKDPTFWEFIPNLISTIPNESRTKRALRYLESLKYSAASSLSSVPAKKMPAGSSNDNGGWGSGVASGSAAFAAAPVVALSTAGRQSNSASKSRGYGYAATISGGRGVTTTGYTGRSLPVTQTKAKSSWGTGNSSAKVAVSRPGSVLVAAATQQSSNGTATKFMAKEKSEERKAKHAESVSKQNVNKKKAKAKAKKNELRNLAFGK